MSSVRRTMARVVLSLTAIPPPPWPFFPLLLRFRVPLWSAPQFSSTEFDHSAVSPGDQLRLVLPLPILAADFSCSPYLCFASTVIFRILWVATLTSQRARSPSSARFSLCSPTLRFPSSPIFRRPRFLPFCYFFRGMNGQRSLFLAAIPVRARDVLSVSRDGFPLPLPRRAFDLPCPGRICRLLAGASLFSPPQPRWFRPARL